MTTATPNVPAPSTLHKAPPAGKATPPASHFQTEAGRRIGRIYDGKPVLLGAFPAEAEWPEMGKETRKLVLMLRDSWVGAATLIERAEAKRAKLAADAELSDFGRNNSLRSFIKAEPLGDFEVLRRVLPLGEAHANALGLGLDLLAPLDAKDAATAALHVELRGLIRAMPADGRSKFLRFEADDETRRAVLLAPAFASGLTPDSHDSLREHTLGKLDPQRLAEWRFLLGAIKATRRALDTSEGLLRAVAQEPPRDSISAKV